MKNKIIIACVIAATLLTAFFIGGREADTEIERITAVNMGASPETAEVPGAKPDKSEPKKDEAAETKTEAPKERNEKEEHEETFLEENADEGYSEPEAETEEIYEAEEQPESSSENLTEEAVNTDAAEQPEQEQTINKAESTENVCVLSVRCDTVLSNKNRLKPEKLSIIPQDGIIYREREVKFTPGESVFDLLLREMKDNKIHMEFSETPAYKTAYVEGIGNLYEFDCGELSGWMYKVNGEFRSVGCSRYFPEPGDRIEWVYSCDMGRDII